MSAVTLVKQEVHKEKNVDCTSIAISENFSPAPCTRSPSLKMGHSGSFLLSQFLKYVSFIQGRMFLLWKKQQKSQSAFSPFVSGNAKEKSQCGVLVSCAIIGFLINWSSSKLITSLKLLDIIFFVSVLRSMESISNSCQWRIRKHHPKHQ